MLLRVPLQDVADLARLKILGSKLKKSAARKEPPSVVLQAMQQQRQVAEGTTTGGGAPAALPAALDVPQGNAPAVPAVVSPSTAAGEASRTCCRRLHGLLSACVGGAAACRPPPQLPAVISSAACGAD